MDPLLIQSCCHRSGSERSSIAGLLPIKSYTGNLPSPLQRMWYVPETKELGCSIIPDSEIRGWIRDAADYHGIPHEMLAVILQQENNPSATKGRQGLQFAERSVTTFMAVVDELLFDLVPDKIPSWSPVRSGAKLADGSSGFVNMSRPTLKSAADYTERLYCKNPMPDDVRYRLLGLDEDSRIPGNDWKADLYYAAAHIRQLIDKVTGEPCHNKALTREQVERVFAAYNGAGPAAAKYGADAMAKLVGAEQGTTTLYFYEK